MTLHDPRLVWFWQYVVFHWVWRFNLRRTPRKAREVRSFAPQFFAKSRFAYSYLIFKKHIKIIFYFKIMFRVWHFLIATYGSNIQKKGKGKKRKLLGKSRLIYSRFMQREPRDVAVIIIKRKVHSWGIELDLACWCHMVFPLIRYGSARRLVPGRGCLWVKCCHSRARFPVLSLRAARFLLLNARSIATLFLFLIFLFSFTEVTTI